ncbi:MAG: hypothetical protein ACAH95_12960 [Fimbriimonas sp.]
MIACLVTLPLIFLPQGGTEEAKQIVAAWRQKVSAAKTISGVADAKSERPTDRMVFRLAKPDLFSLKSPGYEMYSDGSRIVMYTVDQKQYMVLPAGIKEQMGTMLPGLAPFFGSKVPLTEKQLGMGWFRGAPSAELTYSYGTTGTLTLYIDKATSLPLAAVTKFGERSVTMAYSDLKLDEPMSAESFKWTPPEGVTEAQMGGGTDDYEKNLLKVGAKAPDFTIKSPKGGDLNLEKSLKGSKGMLVNFWFYG